MGMFDKWTAEALAEVPNNEIDVLPYGEREYIMEKGTNVHVFRLPFPYSAQDVTSLQASYSQEGMEPLVKDLEVTSSDEETFTCEAKCTLTPEESERFSDRLLDTLLQVRAVYGGSVYYSIIYKVRVLRSI